MKYIVATAAVNDPNTSIVLENMVSEWGNINYAHLSVVLVHLRFLSFVHQTHHWIAKGDMFYGDHLLFARLYEGTQGEIDLVAEKAIGVGTEQNVNLPLQMIQLQRLVQGYGMVNTIPHPTELASRSMAAEQNFMTIISSAVETMKVDGSLTRGVDNMLAAIEDTHEGHIYLLKQKCS